MTPRKTGSPEKLLTEVELELMTHLWRIGEGSVGDIMAELPAGRDLAYTSVSTILRILEQKCIVASRKEGRSHIYRPLVAKEKYEATALNHVVSKVFDGTPVTLVRRLLEDRDLTSDELKSIRKMLKDKLD